MKLLAIGEGSDPVSVHAPSNWTGVCVCVTFVLGPGGRSMELFAAVAAAALPIRFAGLEGVLTSVAQC
jgi:hypothetical protein